MKNVKFKLVFPFPPGDCWCLTRLLHDFSVQFPDYILAPLTPRQEMFLNNPFCREPHPGSEKLNFTFSPGAGRPRYGNCDPAASMVGAIYDFVRSETSLPVRIECLAPEFFPFPDEEKYSIVPADRPVCIMNAGWKSDIPVKFWGYENFTEVVRALSDRILFVQVGAARRGTDFHRPVPGALDLIGKTTIRELSQLVYHADFVLTGISQLHHLAGIQCYKPRHCITVAGAREPENWANCHRRDGVTWHWISVNDRFRHCCEDDPAFHSRPGCWEWDCNSGNPPPCMQSIHPDEIISIFEKVLK